MEGGAVALLRLRQESGSGVWLAEEPSGAAELVQLSDVRAVVEANYSQRVDPDRVSNPHGASRRVDGRRCVRVLRACARVCVGVVNVACVLVRVQGVGGGACAAVQPAVLLCCCVLALTPHALALHAGEHAEEMWQLLDDVPPGVYGRSAAAGAD